MKINNFARIRFAPVLAIGLLAAGAASAQTLTKFYSTADSGSNAFAGAGISDGTLADVGFDVNQVRSETGVAFSDNGGASTRELTGAANLHPAYNISISATAPAAPAGYTELGSVTIYLYANTINPSSTDQSFAIVGGLRGGYITATLPATGGIAPAAPGFVPTANYGVFTLNDDSDLNKYFAITISAADWLAEGGKFSIIDVTNPAVSNSSMNVVTERPNTTTQGPGISFTYVIPEPSAALLGSLSSLLLLRRRRA